MKKLYLLFAIIFLCLSCVKVDNPKNINKLPNIFPDYTQTTIPNNIAPINFTVKEAKYIVAEFRFKNKTIFTAKGKNPKGISISQSKWKQLLQQAKNDTIYVNVYAQTDNNEWFGYKPFFISVSDKTIDPYIVYRLIKPGYELWDKMGLYQRELTSYKERPIIKNSQLTTDKTQVGCINCHSFCQYSPDTFMYHGRAQFPGTVIIRGDESKRINMKTAKTGNGTYPKWHPSGRYIAFSLNKTFQAFHAFCPNKISVYDTESDLIIFDTDKNEIICDNRFLNKKYLETFPTWSPDGQWLYFCRADAPHGQLPGSNDKVQYGIYRVAFDATTTQIGDSIECVIDEKQTGKSQLFPRISPNGRFLLYTEADYGTFPIWHKEAQLRMIDLQTLHTIDIDVINSDDVESYHSWSSNGRWIIFSSRRIDGLYTRLFIAPCFDNGEIGKPFLLPQKTADFDFLRMSSYNIPEFTSKKIRKTSYQIEKIQKGTVTQAHLKK